MIKFFGSHFCPNCKQFLYNLKKYSLDFEFHDISDNLLELKQFLILRDNNKKFERMKEMNGIGIPCIVDDNNIDFHWKDYLHDLGYKVYNLSDLCEDEC